MMDILTQTKMLNRNQAAEYLGVSPGHLRFGLQQVGINSRL